MHLISCILLALSITAWSFPLLSDSDPSLVGVARRDGEDSTDKALSVEKRQLLPLLILSSLLALTSSFPTSIPLLTPPLPTIEPLPLPIESLHPVSAASVGVQVQYCVFVRTLTYFLPDSQVVKYR